MDFCREPRSSKEIYSFLGMTSRGYATSAYIMPLVDSGKLVQTIPIKSSKPKFVAAEYATAIPTNEAILEFCQEPHTKTEIAKYFGASQFQMRKILASLIKSGQLIGEDAANPKNQWQKFFTANTQRAVSKSDRILEFCKIPRHRKEIAELLGINHKYLIRYIRPLVESGKLKMTKPEIPSSIDQRFYSGNADIVVLSEATIREFCQTPKSRSEIAEYFGVRRHLAERYINDYVQDGKLKMTMPLNPICKQQRFVDSTIEIKVFSEEALLEFCKTPKSKEEIHLYFGTTTKGAVSTFINPLLDSGKLLRTFPEYPKHKYQKIYSP